MIDIIKLTINSNEIYNYIYKCALTGKIRHRSIIVVNILVIKTKRLERKH